MHVMARESWTDERLDEFRKRMDERFDRVDERIQELDGKFEQRLGQMDKRLDRIGDGLESVQKAIVFGAITLSSAFVAGLFALVLQA